MLSYHLSKPIYYKHIALLYSPLKPVHRVHILVHAVRPSLLLSGSLAGMFPHVFAVDLLLLSTFLRCYKLLEIERGRFGEDIQPSKEAECLIEIEVTDMATALLVQQL